MTEYEAFRRSSLDTSGIGLTAEPEVSDNLFTPLGAALIGWAGRDNAHFCFLEGYGETVFAVDPAVGCGEFVYPVARSFSAFLGLVLACRGTEAILKAWQWSHLRFRRFLAETKLSLKQQSILRAIRNAYHPPVISDPFSYLIEVRQGFDGSTLQFSPELAEIGVTFPKKPKDLQAVFSGSGKGKPGKKTALNKAFSWGGNQWQVPAIYACKEGLVIDFCVRISQEQDPRELDVRSFVTLNGKRLPEKYGRCAFWDPSDDNEWQALQLLNHYGCDRESGWVFLRKSYLWYNQRKPVVQSLKLTLQAMPVIVPGPQFQAPAVGESVVLPHPLSGKEYTLTVQTYTQEALDRNFLFDYPRNYVCMTYTLSPELPDTAFALRDCGENDPSEPPVILENPEKFSAASVGIIGGEDGPTALFLSHPGEAKGHIACSSFHFAPPETVTWRMDFREKPWEDLSIELAP